MPNNADYCADLVRQADRDRWLATLFAPAEHRDALFALYAFNIEIARVRDLAREPMPGEIRLQWWREVLSGERQGEGEANPVSAALLGALKRHGFVAAPLLELINAHTFDLYDEPMGTADNLELYGIRTQAPLLAMAAGMLNQGAALPETFTLDASIAAGITKVLIDLPRHASRRQLYVPLDVLERHKVDIEDIFAGQATSALRAALADMRTLVRDHLAKAAETLSSAPPQILPAFLSLAVIEQTLLLMDRADYDPFRFRPLAQWRRQWALWRAARKPKRLFAL
ncbi:MAG TPA: phytoene/squalene synthase family protein [Pseudolabrys sp.]|jgi:phytoene synthase